MFERQKQNEWPCKILREHDCTFDVFEILNSENLEIQN